WIAGGAAQTSSSTRCGTPSASPFGIPSSPGTSASVSAATTASSFSLSATATVPGGSEQPTHSHYHPAAAATNTPAPNPPSSTVLRVVMVSRVDPWARPP